MSKCCLSFTLFGLIFYISVIIFFEIVLLPNYTINKLNKSFEDQYNLGDIFRFDNPVALTHVRKSYQQVNKAYKDCPLNEDDNFEIDRFVTIRESPPNSQMESYQITVAIDLIEKSIFGSNGSLFISKCSLEQIWKRSNFKETGNKKELFRGELLEVTRNKNMTTSNRSGTILLRCYSEQKQGVVFQYAYQFFPLNMTRVKELRKGDKLNVEKIVGSMNSSSVINDAEFSFDGCGSVNTGIPKRMNVLMIGTDSLSYNQMRRVLPRTYKYLATELEDNVVFDNFNSVGENTFPNHVSMLCGLDLSRSETQKLIKSLPKNNKSESLKKVHDYYPFIWKQFEELGYITMFQIDNPNINMFTYFKDGFLYSPTDIYNRAFLLLFHQMRQSKVCYHKKPFYRVYYDQIEQFVQAMNMPSNSETPYFSLTFLSEMTHNHLAVPEGLDTRLESLIKSMSSKGFLENTMLIVYGDHGHRISGFSVHTEIGQYERARPFLSIRLPNTFKDTSYLKNLKNNRHKLTSFYDVYQTLRHFLFLNKFDVDHSDSNNPANSGNCRKQFRVNDPELRSYRGVSLLEELDASRGCEEALIPERYCRHFKGIPLGKEEFMLLTKHTMEEATDFVVQQLNNMFDKQQELCELYRLDKVNSFQKIVIKSKKDTAFYKLVLELSPGSSVFDAFLDLDKQGKLRLKSKPVRLSVYGDQSYCVNERINKNYCFCKNQLASKAASVD